MSDCLYWHWSFTLKEAWWSDSLATSQKSIFHINIFFIEQKQEVTHGCILSWAISLVILIVSRVLSFGLFMNMIAPCVGQVHQNHGCQQRYRFIETFSHTQCSLWFIAEILLMIYLKNNQFWRKDDLRGATLNTDVLNRLQTFGIPLEK